MPTILATAIAGGNPPDVADVAQPGLVKQFVQQAPSEADHVREVDDHRRTSRRRGSTWASSTGSSTRFSSRPPTSRPSGTTCRPSSRPASRRRRPGRSSRSDAKTIKASGTPAYSLCGSSGWTLTDLFENIYLRMFGPAKYDQLSHAPDQVDRPVGDEGACKYMAKIIGDSSNLTGGTSGALQTDYPTCVDKAFATPPGGGHGPRRPTSSAWRS